MDSLRLGTGWKPEDLAKPQVMVESTFGDSHPGSGHLDKLVAAACQGIAEEGGHGARYFCTDICDGESQGTDGINFSLASREMIANMIEIHGNATPPPFDGAVYIASCDKGMPANLMGLARVNTSAVVVTGGTMAAGPELLTLEQLGMYSAKYERGEIDEAISKDPNFSLDRREISGLLLFQESRTIFSKKEPQKVPPDKKTSWGKRETV